MKKRKKPDKFLLPHGMPSDEREFAFSSRVLPKALKIKAPYKSWHYQTWFFVLFHHEFRQGNRIAFEILMTLAFAHFFGFFNPKQLADFLDIPHQKLYAQLKDWSIYYLKEMLLRFMIKQAGEHLKPALQKSAATQSRAGLTLSIDNSVMDRFGTLLRCTWNWYSGRYHKVIRGQD